MSYAMSCIVTPTTRSLTRSAGAACWSTAAASPDAGGAGASRVVRDSFVALEDALAVAFARSALVNVAGARFDPRDLARFVVITIQGLRVYGRSQPDPARLRAALAVALAPLTAVGPPSRTAT